MVSDNREGVSILTWVDTKTAGEKTVRLKDHPGGWANVSSPEYSEDIALKIVRN